jgi:hypothetical protein
MSDPDIDNFQPPPESELSSGPEMSTGETLANIFFEPDRVFESLRARPRFLVAGAIIIALSLAFAVLFFQRAGYEEVMRTSVENSSEAAQQSPEERQRTLEIRQHPLVKALYYLSRPIAVAVALLIGSALYLLGTMFAGRKISFAQALAISTYSRFPPDLLAGLLNILLLFLKSADDMDLSQLRGGLVHADLSLLVDVKASPVMAAALGSIDLFAFYGLFLAALGLRKVARLSPGAAWGIVLTIWLAKVILRVTWAATFGTGIG